MLVHGVAEFIQTYRILRVALLPRILQEHGHRLKWQESWAKSENEKHEANISDLTKEIDNHKVGIISFHTFFSLFNGFSKDLISFPNFKKNKLGYFFCKIRFRYNIIHPFPPLPLFFFYLWESFLSLLIQCISKLLGNFECNCGQNRCTSFQETNRKIGTKMSGDIFFLQSY